MSAGWFAITLMPGCSPRATQVNYEHAFPSTADPQIFLVAARQKDRVRVALVDSGFAVVDDLLDSNFYLRVTLGIDKTFRDCGTLNNVKFALRHEGRPVLEFAAAGWTGSCQPNVFDDMSRALMLRFKASSRSSRGVPSVEEKETQ